MLLWVWSGFIPSDAARQMTSEKADFRFPLILTLYFFSGLVSLAYEILWARMLALQFGVSIFGVVITVSVFMFGLGAGSLMGIRVVNRLKNPLRWFALFEGFVGVGALIMPHLFQVMDSGISLLAPQTGLATWYVLQFCLTGIVLLVPALLMGAGFPMILSVFANRSYSLEYIYGINTLGAALGAIIPLILLPAFGWLIALNIIAVGSIVVAVVALIVASRVPLNSAFQNKDTVKDQINTIDLLAYAGVGAVALMLEIAWTRLFGMIFLRTEYVLAIILAVFLLGIGSGSIAARFLKKPNWLNILPIVCALLVIAGLWLIPVAASWIDVNTMDSLAEALVNQGIIIVLLTLPVTFIFGAWLPLLNRKLGAKYSGGASLYGANAVGAMVGALLAGFVLTPYIGTAATIVLAAMILILISQAWSESKKPFLGIPVILLVGFPVLKMPEVSQLLPRVYEDTSDLYQYEDAVNITHVVEKKDGQRVLLADLQRMDASSDPASVESQRNQARLPMLLHHNPQSVLFLGLGTAISASATKELPDLRRTAVEISQGAIHSASRYFDKVNLEIVDATTIIRDDARHYLMSTSERYDVIIGDLFHPDLVGRSALLSTQQFQRVKSRLSDQGVFVQWIALNQFEVNSLKVVLRTFAKVFPDARLFVDAFRLALVGTRGEFPGITSVQKNMARLTSEQDSSITGGEGYWTWLGRYWGPIQVEDGIVQDEWKPQIEFALPRARYNGDLDLSKVLQFLINHRPHVNDAARQLNIKPEDFAEFERAYIGTDLGHRSWLALLFQQSKEGQRLLKLAYQANPNDKWIGFAVVDASLANFDINPSPDVAEQQLLESLLKVRPDHPEVLKRLYNLAVTENDTNRASGYRDRLSQLSPYDNSLR